MKILVPVKRVIDYNVKARVKADGSGVDLSNVKMSTPLPIKNVIDQADYERIWPGLRSDLPQSGQQVVFIFIGVHLRKDSKRRGDGT